MTAAELAALCAAAAERKAAGLPPSIAETVAEARRLVMLGEAGEEAHAEMRTDAGVGQ